MTAPQDQEPSKVEDNCNRCGCPVEVPFLFADEICGPHAVRIGSVCDHTPLCRCCYRLHEVEVADELRCAPGAA